MKLEERQSNGNAQREEKQIIEEYKKEKEPGFILFNNILLFNSLRIYPILWENFELPQKDYINITIKHKSLN